MKKAFYLLLVAGIFSACNNGAVEADSDSADSTEQTVSSEDLKREVMDIHDKVMPEMTPMSKLQRQLTEASVGKADSLDYLSASTELKYAKDAMMTWMRDFSGSFSDSWSEAEKISFLEAEKIKMARIDSLTQEALRKGQMQLAKADTAQVN